jgi:hypothetical protein
LFRKLDDRRCNIVEIVLFIITVLVSVFAEATIGVRFNLTGIGCIVGISLVGAVLLYSIRHKK